jgi:hypothetical protein
MWYTTLCMYMYLSWLEADCLESCSADASLGCEVSQTNHQPASGGYIHTSYTYTKLPLFLTRTLYLNSLYMSIYYCSLYSMPHPLASGCQCGARRPENADTKNTPPVSSTWQAYSSEKEKLYNVHLFSPRQNLRCIDSRVSFPRNSE